jgi:hypothetical protein
MVNNKRRKGEKGRKEKRANKKKDEINKQRK